MTHNNDFAAKIITHMTENQVLLFANDYCNVNHVHSGLATTRVVIKSRGRGFSAATKRVAPGNFYWKIERK